MYPQDAETEEKLPCKLPTTHFLVTEELDVIRRLWLRFADVDSKGQIISSELTFPKLSQMEEISRFDLDIKLSCFLTN